MNVLLFWNGFTWLSEELCTTGDDTGTGQHGEFTILVASNWQVAWHRGGRWVLLSMDPTLRCMLKVDMEPFDRRCIKILTAANFLAMMRGFLTSQVKVLGLEHIFLDLHSSQNENHGHAVFLDSQWRHVVCWTVWQLHPPT